MLSALEMAAMGMRMITAMTATVATMRTRRKAKVEGVEDGGVRRDMHCHGVLSRLTTATTPFTPD